ncbi:MAG: hypothetical protein QG673_2348 [Pseudomonadota bacterium]|nr:hypothetical protein [Pseudomonadota bacterium]
MTTLQINDNIRNPRFYIDIVKCIQKLRSANFTEAQADVVAEIMEQQVQAIQTQQVELDALRTKEHATKGDVRESELKLQKEIEGVRKEIERVRKEIRELEIKLMALYGGGFFILLGVLAKGFHWI